MWDIGFDWITGLMVGIEFPPAREVHEDMSFACVLDLGVVRLTFIKWDRED